MTHLRVPDNKVIFTVEDENKTNFSSIQGIIDKAHNILYNSENIEGESALNDIMNFLFIKMLSIVITDDKIDGKIDLLNKSYYNYNDDFETIFSYFKDLRNLANQSLEEIRSETNFDAIRQMGKVLKYHPITKMIYNEYNFIKAKKGTTIHRLLKEVILDIDINTLKSNEDVIGEIYEHFINKYVKKGSKLGQFFTPRKLMKLILCYQKKNIEELFNKINGHIRVYDSCMGTGGWLVTTYNLFKNDRILLSGGEVKDTTFQYGLMNLITTLNKFPNDVQCESSLTHINNIKHDLIVTNPPFKTSFSYKQLETNYKNDKYNTIDINEIFKLKSNNPLTQFMELNLFKLKDNGMCIIILPYGDFFTGNTKSLINTRKYFLEQTEITDIIVAPPGIFSHTKSIICVLIFKKNATGTKKIKFSKLNKEMTEITHITTVSITDIKKDNILSLNYANYLIEDNKDKNDCKWVEFGKIFQLEKGKLQSTKMIEDENGIVFVTGAKEFKKIKPNKESYVEGENIFISTSGNGDKVPIKYFNGKCNYSNLMSVCKLQDDYLNLINIKYVYYYLVSKKNYIEENYQIGANNKSLDILNFNRMQIPIISINKQIDIVTYCDKNNDLIKELEVQINKYDKDNYNYLYRVIGI